jgi:hypothetical protein
MITNPMRSALLFVFGQPQLGCVAVQTGKKMLE